MNGRRGAAALLVTVIVVSAFWWTYWWLWPPCPPSNTCSPIRIESDSDFTSYSFAGSGTADDPYVIECRAIITKSEYGVYISDTTKHFVIQRCYVDAGRYGISLSNVHTDTAMIDSTVCMSNKYGIYLWNSNGTVIRNSTCNSNENGIVLEHCGLVELYNNTCSYNTMYGIYLLSSETCTVSGGFYNSNAETGIHLMSSPYNMLENSTIQGNTMGIRLGLSDLCEIRFNWLLNNTGYGVYLISSDENGIYQNVFSHNNLLGASQGFDDGTGNIWYDESTFSGNYWSDWPGSGDYFIDGAAGSTDPYPLVIPP